LRLVAWGLMLAAWSSISWALEAWGLRILIHVPWFSA